MHDQVFGAESAALIRQHFAKVDGFRSAAGAPVPVEPAVPQDAAVTAVVQDVLCASLYLDRSEIDPALSFSEMGLDSIGAVELVREVNRAFGLDIDSVAVYDHPTVPRLVSFVRELIARDREIHAEALGAPAVPVTAMVPSVSVPATVVCPMVMRRAPGVVGIVALATV